MVSAAYRGRVWRGRERHHAWFGRHPSGYERLAGDGGKATLADPNVDNVIPANEAAKAILDFRAADPEAAFAALAMQGRQLAERHARSVQDLPTA